MHLQPATKRADEGYGMQATIFALINSAPSAEDSNTMTHANESFLFGLAIMVYTLHEHLIKKLY